MSRIVVIVDDDVAFGQMLVAVLKDAGFLPVLFGSGEEAVAYYDSHRAAGTAVHGFVVDALLPKLNGYEVIDGIKRRGHAGPLVYASGMYYAKDHLAQAQQLGATATFGKPLNNEHLIKALGGRAAEPKKSGGQKRPIPAEGNLLTTPLLHLLWQAQRYEHSGILDVHTADQNHVRLFLLKGMLMLMSSAREGQNVAAVLAKQGLIDEHTYKNTLELAHEQHTGLASVLISEQSVGSSVLNDAYHSLAREILPSVLAARGTFRFTEAEAFRAYLPDIKMAAFDDTVQSLRTIASKELLPHIEPRAAMRLAPGKYFDNVRPHLRSACGGESVVKHLNGRARINQILGSANSEQERLTRMRQLFLLMSTRGVKASLEVIEVQAPAPAVVVAPTRHEPAAPAPATPQPPANSPANNISPMQRVATGTNHFVRAESEEMPLTAEDRLAVKKIVAKFEEVKKSADLWAVLGVDREATDAQIKAAYFALARDFHTDVFAGLQLGTAREKLDELFTTISDAFSTLSDPSKRGEYEAQLSFAEKGMTTDIGALFEAERDFEKGKLLLERGDPASALRFLDKALEVYAGNLLWSATAAYARWWAKRDPREVKEVIKALEAAHADAPGENGLMLYQGKIYLESGDLAMASRRFRALLRADPNNNGAQSYLRRVQKMQEDQEKSKGGFGRFLKR